ncbi:MAG: exo-alpha-sialidase [Myxococcales bacterium]|nr:exo-alpha-sialidase [Myxococcales bacterium]MCB9579413.1 exo-alpha-sialidase [Polyangiaceae bacterium]
MRTTLLVAAVALSACSSNDSSSARPQDAGSDHVAVDAPEDVVLTEAGGDAATDAGSGPIDLSSSPGSGFESETHVVRAPGGRMLAVWMNLGASGVQNGYALSEDDGASWSSPKVLSGTPTKGDPVATYGQDGSLYYGFLDGNCGAQGCDNGHVWVARLAPGSTSFEAPVDASPANPAEFYDKPWLMTGADGTLVLVVAARQGQNPTNIDRIVVARSTDGTSWSHSEAVPTLPQGQIAGIPHACVSPQGSRLWVVYVDSSSPSYAGLRWSDDLGQTWPAGNHSSGFAPASSLGALQAYDLRCVGEQNDVWLMYGLASGSSSATGIPPLDEIHVAHSADGGNTWNGNAVISESGAQFLRPEIVRTPSGDLFVMAYGGSHEGDTNGSVRWWRSTDAGQSFTAGGTLHAPITFTGDRQSSLWIGDYGGLVALPSGFAATFADNHSGNAHVLFAKLAL